MDVKHMVPLSYYQNTQRMSMLSMYEYLKRLGTWRNPFLTYNYIAF